MFLYKDPAAEGGQLSIGEIDYEFVMQERIDCNFEGLRVTDPVCATRAQGNSEGVWHNIAEIYPYLVEGRLLCRDLAR